MTFSQAETAEFLGITQQRLSYWLQRGAIEVEGGGQPGLRCQFTPGDILRSLIVKKILDAGARLQEVRRALQPLKDIQDVDDVRALQATWLCVEPGTGRPTWYHSDRQALLRIKESDVYLIDMQEAKQKTLQALQEENAPSDIAHQP